MKSILDPSFPYVHSSKQDLRKTFAREYRRLEEEAKRGTEQKPADVHLVNVTPIKKPAAAK